MVVGLKLMKWVMWWMMLGFREYLYTIDSLKNIWYN
jgi:hypothetical protein